MAIKIVVKKSAKGITPKTKALKQEISKLVSKANKRLRRLEKNDFTDALAYQNWLKYKNGEMFSVRNKNYNELKREQNRLNHFLNAETSTIRGINRVLKKTAEIVNVKYSKVGELKFKLSGFFTLYNKLEEYLHNVENSAIALGYKQIWEVINTYAEQEKLDYSKIGDDVEAIVAKMAEFNIYESIQERFLKENRSLLSENGFIDV